ncbi:fimbrial protein [Ralstonia sp. L16]|uniref:fimbrial protein n=1 Tax=unclassified Ralstonia TaxID=209769 RepID=UPI003F7AE7D1
MTKRLSAQVMRRIGCTVLAALIFPVSTSALANTAIYPFPALLTLPKNTPVNKVVARAYRTPQELCGAATCRLSNFAAFNLRGNTWHMWDTGPLAGTEIVNLDMQVIVNGKPQTKIEGGSDPVEFSSPVEFQLVRNKSENLVNGISHDKLQFWFFTQTKPGTTVIQNYIKFDTSLTWLEGSCSVPSQTVELPSTRAGRLTGIGTTAGERSFQIQINNCPKGYSKILYRLTPEGGTIENAPGVLPLSADSTAKGVKIKVTDNAGAAAAFDTSINVDDYNKDTGGSFSIPMRVSYVQTEANITPGTVNGAMSVLMEYQ